MSLSSTGNISVPGSPSTLNAAGRPSAGQLVTARHSGASPTTLTKYDLTTLTQSGGSTSAVGHVGVAITQVSNDKFVSISSTNCAFYNAAAETVAVGGSVSALYNTNRPQQMAGSADIGYATAAASGTLTKFDFTGVGTAAVITPAWLVGRAVSNIIVRHDTLTYIFACGDMSIYEVNGSTDLPIRSYALPPVDYEYAVGGTVPLPEVTSIAYANGLLLVATTAGVILVMHHETGKELMRIPCPIGGAALSNAVGAVVYMGALQGGSSVVRPLQEIDFHRTPARTTGYLFSSVAISGMKTIVQQGTKVWFLQPGSLEIPTAGITGLRALSSLVSSAADPGAVEAELVVIQDGGVGTAEVDVCSMIPAAGATIPVTDGANSILLARYKIGSHERFDVRRVST